MKIAPDDGGLPAMAVQSLVGPAPSSPGVFSYDSPGLALDPNSTYWVIYTSQESDGDAFNIDLVEGSGETSMDGWLIGDALFSSLDQGGSWTFTSSEPARFGIDAFAVVPEPGGVAIVTSLILGTFVLRRRRAARSVMALRSTLKS